MSTLGWNFCLATGLLFLCCLQAVILEQEEGYFYVADATLLHTLSSDGSSKNPIAYTWAAGGVHDITVDVPADLLFFSSDTNITRTNMRGFNPILISATKSYGITFNPTSKALYYTDYDANKIVSCSYTGQEAVDLLTGLDKPRDLEFVKFDGKDYLYWTEDVAAPAYVWRVQLNGASAAGAKEKVSKKTDAANAQELTYRHGDVYWSYGGNKVAKLTVHKTVQDGTEVDVTVSASITEIKGMLVFRDELYLTGHSSGKLYFPNGTELNSDPFTTPTALFLIMTKERTTQAPTTTTPNTTTPSPTSKPGPDTVIIVSVVVVPVGSGASIILIIVVCICKCKCCHCKNNSVSSADGANQTTQPGKPHMNNETGELDAVV